MGFEGRFESYASNFRASGLSNANLPKHGEQDLQMMRPQNNISEDAFSVSQLPAEL